MEKTKPKSKKNGNKSVTTKSRPEEIVEMPAEFARALIKQIVYNPQKTSAQKSYNYSVYSKENILNWLKSPASNEKNLRDASNYMYLSSMQYQRLIQYYANLNIGAYVISPISFDPSAVNADTFSKQYAKNAKVLELMDVPNMIREILVVAQRDGAFYGVRWADKNSSFIQKIDADYCKITSISDSGFLYSVDMTKVAGKLEFYHPTFAEMYMAYLATAQKWQEVPADVSVCVKADSSIVDFTVPPFEATMPSLYTIANAESLQETADELKNYKMISGEVPVDDNGNPKMGYDLFTKYYSHLRNAVGENVGVAVTPFKLGAFTFEQKTGVSDVDDVSKATNNFWAAAGTSGLLHGVTNETAGVTKLAIKSDESYVLGMVKQVEKNINRYLKTSITGTVKFKISILPITIFNKDEYVKNYKESSAFGIGKSYYAAALGIPQVDLIGLNYIEKNVLKFEELTPMKSSFNSSEDNKSAAGRPPSADEDLDAAGEATKASGANENRG